MREKRGTSCSWWSLCGAWIALTISGAGCSPPGTGMMVTSGGTGGASTMMGDVDAGVPARATAMLGPLVSSPTTEDGTLVAVHALVSPPDHGAPSDPTVLAKWIAMGYGATEAGPAEPVVGSAPPSETIPAPGPNPKLVIRFAHLPDTQIADDESPNRTCFVDAPGELAGAFRPQEGDQCRVLDAAVRTINAIHARLPIQLVLTGGDNADDAQKNEAKWFMQILDGAPVVRCDSGDFDDPVPGPDNDGKDPFFAAGLAMPWLWVNGNHDVLVQGNFVVNAAKKAAAVGVDAILGTRDYSQPGGPLTSGPVVADAEREPLLRTELMALVAADADGHGLGPAQVTLGKTDYAYDVPGTQLRFILLDSNAETGGDDGMIHQADVDAVLKPLFDAALADGKWVVIASHHASDSKSDGSGVGGTKQADALTADAWLNFLGNYPNLLFSMVGHAHENRVRYMTPQVGHGFWEVMTSALADYPHEFRIVEIWDEDNGWARLRGVVTNYATDGDAVAPLGRALGVADAISGWAHDGSGLASDRNVDLYIRTP